jgi:pyridoxal phosphate enzyme, YggS family
MSAEEIQKNVAEVRERIADAARKAGRRAEEITLIAVSKTHPAAAIREAFAAGIRDFGENRVQEWEGKRGGVEDLPGQWHLIGHLQSNKASRAAKIFHSVDSLDDYALAQRLDRARAEAAGAENLRVLIEVRVAAEETKSGVERNLLPELAEKIGELGRLELAGLMCIPPFLEDAANVRPYFAELRELKEKLETRLGKKLPVLSMGMSHDFAVAIEEGATEVRVGTALFGAREKTE